MKDEKSMKRDHRHQQLQSTLRDITEELQCPGIIDMLEDKASTREFWRGVDLKSLV